MNYKLIFLVFIVNLFIITVHHYNSVNCSQIYRRTNAHSRIYHNVPYNIYGVPFTPIIMNHRINHTPNVLQYPLKIQSYDNPILRRQFIVGNPIVDPFTLPVLSKSRRLFSNFINLRQSQLITSVLAGPLALATVIFALPLLPSLFMAPLAFAGIPQAMTMMQDFMHSFGATGKPINSLFSSFIDPLVSPLGTVSSGDSSTGKPNKLNPFKNIARLFRVVINRRVASASQIDNVTTSTIDSLIEPENIIDENDIQTNGASLNNTHALFDSIKNLTDPSILSSTIPSENDNNTSTILSSIPNPILNNLNSNDLKKSFRSMENMFGSLREIYSIIREGLRRYEITDSQCQSRIVCEIHQKIVGRKRTMLKSFALNAIDVLSIESRIDGWNNLNDKSKETIKFYISAAKKGLADENCESEFSKCPALPLKSRMLRSLVLDSGHLIKTFSRNL